MKKMFVALTITIGLIIAASATKFTDAYGEINTIQITFRPVFHKRPPILYFEGYSGYSTSQHTTLNVPAPEPYMSPTLNWPTDADGEQKVIHIAWRSIDNKPPQRTCLEAVWDRIAQMAGHVIMGIVIHKAKVVYDNAEYTLNTPRKYIRIHLSDEEWEKIVQAANQSSGWTIY